MESYKNKKQSNKELQEVEHMTLKLNKNENCLRIKYSDKKYTFPIDIKMKIKKFPFGDNDEFGGVFGISYDNKSLWTNWEYSSEIVCYCFFNGTLWGELTFKDNPQYYWKAENGFKEIILSIKNDGKVYYIIDNIDRGLAFNMCHKEFYIFIGIALDGEIEIC